MSALAAFSLAMTSAWKNAEDGQSLSVLGSQAVTRMQFEVRQSALIGACRTGSIDGTSATGAAVMLWKQDVNGDGAIQGSEVQMIEHLPASDTIVVYNGGPNDTATWAHSVFATSAVLDNFKIGRTGTPLVRGVEGATFQAMGTGSATETPTLRFALKLMARRSTDGGGGGTTTPDPAGRHIVQYGTATVRAPAAIPS
jgi:hypothetical protein